MSDNMMKPRTAADDTPATSATIQAEIDKTRDSLSKTLDQLQAKVTSGDLRETVEAEVAKLQDRARSIISEQMVEAKSFLAGQVGEAKAMIREEMTELEGKAREGLVEAAGALKSTAFELKDSIKEDLRSAFTDAKQSLRAATVGRVEALATTIGDKMNDTKVTIIDTVRANPIPTALIGAGLLWMIFNRGGSTRQVRRSSQRSFNPTGTLDYGDDAQSELRGAVNEVENRVNDAGQRISQVAKQAVDKLGTAVHSVGDVAGKVATQAQTTARSIAQGASDTASRVASQAGQVYERASQGARMGIERVNRGYSTTLEENPLAIAGAVLAIGAIIGLSIPRTEREDSLLGPSRDRLLRRAGQSVQEAASSLAGLAEDAIEGVQRSSKEPARA